MWSVIELIETFFCNSYVVGIYERKTIVFFFVPEKTKQKWKEILTTEVILYLLMCCSIKHVVFEICIPLSLQNANYISGVKNYLLTKFQKVSLKYYITIWSIKYKLKYIQISTVHQNKKKCSLLRCFVPNMVTFIRKMTEALNYTVILCLLLGIKENWTGDFKQMFIMGKNGEKSEIFIPRQKLKK